MNSKLLATAAALSMVAVPAIAATTNSVADKRAIDAETSQLAPSTFKAADDAWGEGAPVLYFGWDAALRDYYATLDAEQQALWPMLAREQQIALFQMTGGRDQVAWDKLTDSQPVTATTTTRTTVSGATMEFVKTPVVQPVDAPHTGDYPVCRSDADDSCINAWEAGERGPGVNRPLAYYPGDATMS